MIQIASASDDELVNAGNDEETESCIDTVSVPDDELNYINDVDTQGEEETCQD